MLKIKDKFFELNYDQYVKEDGTRSEKYKLVNKDYDDKLVVEVRDNSVLFNATYSNGTSEFNKNIWISRRWLVGKKYGLPYVAPTSPTNC